MIKSLIEKFYKKKFPCIGEKWILKGDDSPWPKNYKPVTIIDIKDGWVRYAFCDSFMSDELELDTFLAIYKFIGD